MKLTVVQPSWFPNVRLLSRIASADVVVWGDVFLYKKHDTINRTKIKTIAGPQWLTIPVLTKRKKKQRIIDVHIDVDHHWKHQHLKSLEVSYQKSPYFFFLSEGIRELIYREWLTLEELLFQSTLFLCKKMNINVYFVKSSDLPLVKERSERVVQWMKACGCDSYLIPGEDESLIDVNFIKQQGVSLFSFNFKEQKYHQLFGDFLSDLSGLDLLFNEGELSRSILLKAVRALKIDCLR